jgi:hypothetical protein
MDCEGGMASRELFIKKKVLPRTFVEVLAAGLSGSWTTWEPETLLTEIQRVWNVDPSPPVFEKILALQTLLVTNAFWDDALVFENTILAFNDHVSDPDMLKSAHPREIALGMTLAIDVRDKADFIHDVEAYIRACHVEYGVLVYHPILAFAQPKYEDDTRRSIVEYVQKEIDSGRAPVENLNHANPIEVQFLKSWEVLRYVEECVAEGKRVAEEAKSA